MNLREIYAEDERAVRFIESLRTSSEQLVGILSVTPGPITKFYKDGNLVAFLNVANGMVIKTSKRVNEFAWVKGRVEKHIKQCDDIKKDYRFYVVANLSDVQDNKSGRRLNVGLINLLEELQFDNDIAFMWRISAMAYKAKNLRNQPNYKAVEIKTTAIGLKKLSVDAMRFAVDVYPDFVDWLKTSSSADFEERIKNYEDARRQAEAVTRAFNGI